MIHLGWKWNRRYPVTFSRKDKYSWAFGALQVAGQCPWGHTARGADSGHGDTVCQESWTAGPQAQQWYQQQLLKHHLCWGLFQGITPQNTRVNATPIPTHIWVQPQLFSTSSSEEKCRNFPLEWWLCSAPGIPSQCCAWGSGQPRAHVCIRSWGVHTLLMPIKPWITTVLTQATAARCPWGMKSS